MISFRTLKYYFRYSKTSLFVPLQGFTAKDEFYVTYRNEALNSSMVEVVVNTLRYFLDRPDIEAEDSY